MITGIFVVGISYKTTPIDIREKVFLRPIERELLLSALKNNPLFIEGFVISTCNRTEIYINAASSELSKDTIIDLLLKIKKIPNNHPMRQSFYSYSGQESLRHLMRVITGLESIVLGEKQILGQVKEAIELARTNGMFQKTFNVLSDLVVRAGKKAQRETEISCGGGSISWAAVKAAQEILETLQNKKVLIIGAGKMSALTADQLKNKQLGQLYIMNRTLENAVVLAQKLGGQVVSFMDIKEILSKVDICICSASAPYYLVNYELMQKVMGLREFKEILCIDISTPRTIDPRIKNLKAVKLLDIDHLEQAINDNMEKRKAAINCVETIINQKLFEFDIKMSKLLTSASIPSANK